MTETLNISTTHESNYRLIFPFIPFLNSDLDKEKKSSFQLYCKTVTLPAVELETIDVETATVTLKEPTNKLRTADLTVTFAIDEFFKNYTFIYNWMLAIKTPEKWPLKTKNTKIDASLIILTNNKNPKLQVKLIDLFPKNLSEVPFSYITDTSNDLIATAIFSLNYFLIEPTT